MSWPGAAARVWAARPRLTASQVTRILLTSARELRPALLLLPAASRLLDEAGLARILAEASSPLLLVR